MKREAIKKPNFMRLFAVRFIISCMVFLSVASFLLYWMDREIDSYQHDWTYISKIGEKAGALYEAEPGSEEYNGILSELKLAIAFHQSEWHNYAEVHIGSDVITAQDIAYIIVNDNNHNVFIIEDMSYLDPLFQYENGRLNPKDYYCWIEKNQFEFVYRIANDLIRKNDCGIYDKSYSIKDAYINREKNTFIPGKIKVIDFGTEYIVDCTPKDTKGYERIEPGWTSDTLQFCYRLDPKLTSNDVNRYFGPYVNDKPETYIPDVTFFEKEYDKTMPWYVGFRDDSIDHSVFETAPVTSRCIVITAVVLAGIVAFVLANIRYHKDNTVWKIFEYRTKVAEAMAHDLKTPLAAIGAYAESMESFPGDASKTAEYTAKITEKVAAMDHMIEDILVLSKSEKDKANIASEEVSILSLVNASLKSFPDMKTAIAGDDVTLKTDRRLLAQAVDNLLSNCDRYGEKGSPVDITITPEKLTIANKTKETYSDVESLKKPFVKGSDSRNDKGTGLGLSIADNNLNILGYKLELSSQDGVFEARIKYK
jgi:hypothetical protein